MLTGVLVVAVIVERSLRIRLELAFPALGGGSVGGRKPLIVTGTNFGKGMVLRCPWCNVSSPFKVECRGADIACPNCQGPLRVNSFVVGK